MLLAFFLIVPSVIVVTIFLVHSIAHRIGFKVKYFSLVLCAFMSLAVNFAAIEMSTYLDKWHYVRLGALIFVASLIVTLVNRYLIKHEKTDVTIITDIAEIEEELSIEETNEKQIEAAKTVEVAKSLEPVKPKVEAKVPQKEEKSSEPKIATSPKEDKPKTVAVEKMTDTKKPEKSKSTETSSERSDVKKQVKTDKPTEPQTPIKSIDKSTETKISVKPAEKATEAKKPEIESKISTKTSSQKLSIIDKIDKPGQATKVDKIDKTSKPEDKPQAAKSNTEADKMLDINAHLGSLDDILDYAYAQKSKGDLKLAILAYQKALDRYKNDDYAPFIAIDLGNIYKEQAAYTKFIKTYEEALKLPVVMRNADTRREFTKNLSYMRIVQSVLVRHRALTIPFSKIPRQYLQEVDNEFKSLQFNSSSRRHL